MTGTNPATAARVLVAQPWLNNDDLLPMQYNDLRLQSHRNARVLWIAHFIRQVFGEFESQTCCMARSQSSRAWRAKSALRSAGTSPQKELPYASVIIAGGTAIMMHADIQSERDVQYLFADTNGDSEEWSSW
jgi:hypothetical protein